MFRVRVDASSSIQDLELACLQTLVFCIRVRRIFDIVLKELACLRTLLFDVASTLTCFEIALFEIVLLGFF